MAEEGPVVVFAQPGQPGFLPKPGETASGLDPRGDLSNDDFAVMEARAGGGGAGVVAWLIFAVLLWVATWWFWGGQPETGQFVPFVLTIPA